LAYPTTDYEEPTGALKSYVSVLEDYSDAIIRFVTSPKTGLQRRSKFAPRLAELVTACDEAAAYIAKVDRFQNWGSQNEQLAIEGPQEPKLTEAELKAKYGPNWGIDQTDGAVARQSAPVPTWNEIAEAYGKDPSRLKALTETPLMNRKSTKA
jgi:hypothetical protein